MEEVNVVSLEDVVANGLDLQNNMKPEDKGYDQITRANDMLLKHQEEFIKLDDDRDIADRKLKLEEDKLAHEREKLEFEREKAKLEDEAKARDAEIQKVTNKVTLIGALTTTALGVGKIAADIWLMNKVGKFEEKGVWRSTASRLAINKFGKK